MAMESKYNYVDTQSHFYATNALARVELAVRGLGAVDPFVRVRIGDDQGVFFLGKFVTGDGFIQRNIAVKCYIPALSTSEESDNPHAVQQFKNGFEKCVANRNNSGLPVLVTAESAAPLQELPSLFFCTKQECFFSPPCPSCGRPLSECKEDGLLRDYGLHSYSTSTHRYLYCPTCTAGDAVTFYTASREREPDIPNVFDGADLINAFGKLQESPGAAASDFSCLDCPSRQTCYAPGGAPAEAGRLIRPFSFYPFYAYAVEYLPLNIGEYSDLIGGLSLSKLGERLARQSNDERISLIKAQFDADRRPLGQTAVDVLAAKLSAFLALCHALKRSGWAPSALDVTSVLVDAAHYTPSNGTFFPRVAVWHSSTANTPVVPEAGEAACQTGKFKLLSVDETASDSGQFQITALLQPVGPVQADERQTYQITFGKDEGFDEDHQVVFSVAGCDNGKLRLQSQPVSLTNANVVKQLKAYAFLPEIDIRFHATLPAQASQAAVAPPGLAKLFFRILLANEQQDVGQILGRCGSLVQQPNGEFSEWLAGFYADPVLGVANLHYSPHDTGTISVPLWSRILAFGLRLGGYIAPAVDPKENGLDQIIASLYELLGATTRGSAPAASDSPEAAVVQPAATDLVSVLAELIIDTEWLARVEAAGLLRDRPASAVAPVAAKPSSAMRNPPETGSAPVPVATPSAPSVAFDDASLDETMIVSREAMTAALKSGQARVQQQTVPPTVAVEERSSEPGLDETVIIPVNRPRS